MYWKGWSYIEPGVRLQAEIAGATVNVEKDKDGAWSASMYCPGFYYSDSGYRSQDAAVNAAVEFACAYMMAACKSMAESPVMFRAQGRGRVLSEEEDSCVKV